MVTDHDAGFHDEPVYGVAADYLTSWQKENYGRMAELVATLMREATHGETARMVRESCSGSELEAYSIHRLDFQAAVVCEVDVSLMRAGEVTRARMRWIREGEDGMAAMPNQPGEWRLAIWTPSAIINRADGD